MKSKGDNLRIPVNNVVNPKMKSLTESVSIRLRYVFWRSFLVEKVTIITLILRKETVNPIDTKVTDTALWKNVSLDEVPFKEDPVVFPTRSLNVLLLINMILSLAESEFKTLVSLSLINCSLSFMCSDLSLAVMFSVSGPNACLSVDLL